MRLIVPKKVKEGEPLWFLTSILLQIIEKIEGGPFGAKVSQEKFKE